jgi:hypothetical protein
MYWVRISTSPCFGVGIGDSAMAKFAAVGSPTGRLAIVHALFTVFGICFITFLVRREEFVVDLG